VLSARTARPKGTDAPLGGGVASAVELGGASSKAGSTSSMVRRAPSAAPARPQCNKSARPAMPRVAKILPRRGPCGASSMRSPAPPRNITACSPTTFSPPRKRGKADGLPASALAGHTVGAAVRRRIAIAKRPGAGRGGPSPSCRAVPEGASHLVAVVHLEDLDVEIGTEAARARRRFDQPSGRMLTPMLKLGAKNDRDLLAHRRRPSCLCASVRPVVPTTGGRRAVTPHKPRGCRKRTFGGE